MDNYLLNILRQINSPVCFGPAIKILNQINIPKLNNEIILLLRNVVRINNKDLKQFDGLVITVKVIKQTLNHDYTNEEWLTIGENYCSLVISVFDSILFYINTPYITNELFCNLILEAGKALLPVVDKTECLRVTLNNNGYSSLLQMLCLDELNFLVRKEIFLLLKPIIVKSDTRQRKNIMNTNELFLSKMAAFTITCGDYETQEAIVEVLMRFSYTSKQKLNKILFWFRKYPSVLTATRLLDYKNFDISCRKFLNSVNDTINSENKVLTIPCLEAYANDIKLQKPNSEQYQELWVDFSLKTGIIHIVCDSGANNAWLRLDIESKNVRKSFFSSRFFEKNQTRVKGKQILIELIAPLEIKLQLMESLIVSVTLVFVESPKLDYLQTKFFDKWYQHLNKSGKNNQFEAVSKAYRENVLGQRHIHHDMFFAGASVSSLSSIRSSSTCSFANGCSKELQRRILLPGNIRRSADSNRNRLPFLTSTPKSQRSQELSTQTKQNLPGKICLGAENFESSPTPLVDLRTTPSISGGIFNNSRISQNTEVKSSIVKGISISDDKHEDSLFKKMLEESLKKEEIKQLNNQSKNKSSIELNTNNTSSFQEEENPQKGDKGRLNSLQLKRKTAKPEMSNNNAEKISESKTNVLENSGTDNKIIEKDSSEESTFVMMTCSNKETKPTNNKKELAENNDSSLSQIGSTSDELPIRPARKQISLLNPEKIAQITKTKLKPQKNSEKSSTLETTIIAPDEGAHMTTSCGKSSPITSKKPIIHSPYLKLFNINNSTSSDQSKQIQLNEVTDNKSEKYMSPKKTESKNTVFKLKPSILNNINDPTLSLPSSGTFSTGNNSNTFANINEKSTETKYTKWQMNTPQVVQVLIHNDDKLDDSSLKKINNLNLTKISGKGKWASKPENISIVNNSKDRLFVIDGDNTCEDKDKNKIKVPNGIGDKEQYKGCTTDSVINAKQPEEKSTSQLLSGCENNNGSSGNNDLTKCSPNHNLCNKIKETNGLLGKENTFVDFSPQYEPTKKSKTSLNSEKVCNHSDSAKNSENSLKDRNSKEPKRQIISKKRYRKGSTDTFAESSLGPSTTLSSMQSYHCIGIPERTYSSRPMRTRAPLTPDQIFDNLKRTATNKIRKKTRVPPRKRKLFTPNSSMEEVSPCKPSDVSSHLSDNMFKDNPGKTNKKKHLFSSNTVKQFREEESVLNSLKPLANVYDFSDTNNSLETKKDQKVLNIRRKSLRTKKVKHYKEVSSGVSDEMTNEFIPRKKRNMTKKKTADSRNVLSLPSEQMSVDEKVSGFVLRMKDRRDILRDDDLESEMELLEASVEEDKSDVSQLEVVEPPVCLSTREINVPSPQPSADSCSDISLSAPTEKLECTSNAAEIKNEIDFLQSAIKNIECLSMTVKRSHPKINSQEKFLSAVESFTNSNVEEMNKKWVEARNSLQHMAANLENLSESCTAFLKSFEKRMKDMIESSYSVMKSDRSVSDKRSEDLCKELKKMCQNRHDILKKL